MKRRSRARLLTRGRGLAAGFRATTARFRLRAGRAAIGGVQWGQLILVLACIGVGVGMVIVAETARANADRHRRAQVLVETIRAESQQLNAIRLQVMLGAVLGSRGGTVHTARGHVIVNTSLLSTGSGSWRELSAALLALRALEPDARTAHLEGDAGALFTLGVHALAASTKKTLTAGIEYGERAFTPVINRLNSDAQRDSAYERQVADRSSSDAVTAFVLSFVLGLLALGVAPPAAAAQDRDRGRPPSIRNPQRGAAAGARRALDRCRFGDRARPARHLAGAVARASPWL